MAYIVASIFKSQYYSKLVKHSELNSGTQNKAFSLQFIILLVETLEKYTVSLLFENIIL